MLLAPSIQGCIHNLYNNQISFSHYEKKRLARVTALSVSEMKSPPVLLFLLALTLTFFQPPSASAESTCAYGTCLPKLSRPKCSAAPTVPSRRRSLPRRNALATRDEEPFVKSLSPDALEPIASEPHIRRGNGICYFLKPRNGGSAWERVGQGSEIFYLPAGMYALKWMSVQDPTREFLPFPSLPSPAPLSIHHTLRKPSPNLPLFPRNTTPQTNAFRPD